VALRGLYFEAPLATGKSACLYKSQVTGINMMEDNDLRLSSVRISPERISELDDNHVIRSIEKKDIVSIVLKYGASSERLTVQIIASTILIILGIYVGIIPTLKLISDIYLETGVNVGHLGKGLFFLVFPICFIPFGIYLIWIGIRKRYYLLVKTSTDQRRILFSDDISFTEVSAFIDLAREKYLYPIDAYLKNR